MHVVHVTEAWNGGIATYINTLLRQQVKQNGIQKLTLIYDPDEASRDFDRAFYEAQNIELIPYNSRRNPLHIIGIAKTLKATLEKLNPDIIHLHSTFPGVYGRIFKGSWKTLYCAHGWSFVQETGAFKKAIYKTAEAFLAKRTDAIINISEHEFEEANKAGVKAPIHCAILSGVEDREASLDVSFSPDPEALNFGFIGRLDYKKGFDVLARIFSQPEMQNHQLYVMGAANRDGHGSDVPESENIHYLGWVPHDQIDGYIQKLDAVIVSSRQEGFGLTAVEAMRNGCVPIVSNRGGLPELIEHEKDGFVFDLENAEDELPKLLHSLDKKELSKTGAHARKSYEKKYTAERFGADILKVYKEVISASDK